MEIAVHYSDMKFYDEKSECLIQKVLAKGSELQSIASDAAVSVLICDGKTIRDLNREYRGIDASTDVLSFALNEGEGDVPEEETELGDIVINVERAKEQASEFGHGEEREIAYLAVHGFLHILGYDHYEEKDKKKMRCAEEEILSACGLERVVKGENRR